MKILLVIGTPYFQGHGGAQKNCRSLMEALAARGHACRVLSFGPPPDPQARAEFLERLKAVGIQMTDSSAQADIYQHQGIQVHSLHNSLQLRAYALKQIQHFNPTRILLAEDWSNLLDLAREVGPERIVYLVQSTVNLPFGPLGFVSNPAKTQLFRQVGGVTATSNYLQEYIRRWSGREAELIPFMAYGAGPFANYADFQRGYVTLINPCVVKGLPLFLKLAQALPEVAFAAVPTWGTTAEDRAALEALPNVTLLPPRDNVDEIYAQTRVLLVPSLCDEAFGAVVVEAMLRGLPVLASDVGGLPEAKLGVKYILPVRPVERYEAGVDDRGFPIPVVPEQDSAPWEQALRELLSDREPYTQLSTQSRAVALALLDRLGIDRLELYLEGLASQPQPNPIQATAQTSQADPWQRFGELTAERRTLLARRLRKVTE